MPDDAATVHNRVFSKGRIMKTRHFVATVVAAGFALSASAQQNLKPGLWEITNNMKSSSGEMEKAQAQMQQQMANMPPEQRKKMQEMLAQHGVQMGVKGSGGMTMKTCMTKEQV